MNVSKINPLEFFSLAMASIPTLGHERSFHLFFATVKRPQSHSILGAFNPRTHNARCSY